MDNAIRCQSCGMPIEEGYFGTNKDGSENKQFCTFCYQNGAFSEPEVTIEDMIERSVSFMTVELNFEEKKARELSQKIIPTLDRWKK